MAEPITELFNRINDAKDMLEQMKLCLYNGQLIDRPNKKQFLHHRKNINKVLKMDDLKTLLNKINSNHTK